MNATTYGLDVAKRVFQIYWVDADTGEIVNRRFGRNDLIEYLSRRPPGRDVKTRRTRGFRGHQTPAAMTIVDPEPNWKVDSARKKAHVEFSHNLGRVLPTNLNR